MTSCEKVVQGIWEFLDHEMTADTLADVRKHLDLCRSCFSRVEFEELLRKHCREKTNRCCPDKLKLKIQQIIELY
jgi:anti-sigma factor (TIGR02949 family)